jgi:glycosyltransferase involved in cell wall biosynthesis
LQKKQVNFPEVPLKILMLTQYPFVAEDERLGGIMQASYRLVRAIDSLDDKRIQLYVLTQSPHIASRVVRKLPNGTPIIYVPLIDSALDELLFGYPPVSKALKKTIREVSPDLIHGQGTAKYIYAAIRSRKKHIITIHGIYRDEMKVVKSNLSARDKLARFVKLKLEQRYIAQISNLIAITPEVATYVRTSAPPVQIFNIENTIDEQFFAIEPLGANKSPTILFVAAITFRKGLDFLLAAFLEVLRALPQAKLRIAGIWDWDPAYVENLRIQYKPLIEAGSVSFLGGITQEQLIIEMDAACLLCLPSRAESAPMVISQAMASARPVVASCVGGIPNMITDGVNGRLWNVGDGASLSRILIDMLSDPDTAGKMGRNGRLMAVDRYSSQSVASKTINAYIRVAGNQ